jgi:hypothetical protein
VVTAATATAAAAAVSTAAAETAVVAAAMTATTAEPAEPAVVAAVATLVGSVRSAVVIAPSLAPPAPRGPPHKEVETPDNGEDRQEKVRRRVMKDSHEPANLLALSASAPAARSSSPSRPAL